MTDVIPFLPHTTLKSSHVTPKTPGIARLWIRHLLERANIHDETRQHIDQIVTELVTNVLQHSPGACEITMRTTHRGVIVSVADQGTDRIALRHTERLAENGRGLALVRELATKVNLVADPLGRAITAVISNDF